MTETDKQNIYDALVQLLTVQCNTCIDKGRKDKIMLCAFILELINYSESVMSPACVLLEDETKISLSDGEYLLLEDESDADFYDSDSEKLWEYLARVLNVPLETTEYKINNCRCVNGVCALC